VKTGLLLIVTVAFAPEPVAVILFPTKLTKVIPPEVPTVEPSSWIVIPAIAGDPPPPAGDTCQVHPPEPSETGT